MFGKTNVVSGQKSVNTQKGYFSPDSTHCAAPKQELFFEALRR